MWGSSSQANVGASTAETYVGSGNIDIAQVQLCAGDVALPFMPKSFEEELRACQRYFVEIAQGAGEGSPLGVGGTRSATYAVIYIKFPVPMRIAPSTAYVTSDITKFSIKDIAGTNKAASAATSYATNKLGANLEFTVASGLGVNCPAFLECNTAGNKLGFSAEL